MCNYIGRRRDVLAHQNVCKAYKKAEAKINGKYDAMMRETYHKMNVKYPENWMSINIDDSDRNINI